MTVNQLISKLQELATTHGEATVCYYDGDNGSTLVKFALVSRTRLHLVRLNDEEIDNIAWEPFEGNLGAGG